MMSFFMLNFFKFVNYQNNVINLFTFFSFKSYLENLSVLFVGLFI